MMNTTNMLKYNNELTIHLEELVNGIKYMDKQSDIKSTVFKMASEVLSQRDLQELLKNFQQG